MKLLKCIFILNILHFHGFASSFGFDKEVKNDLAPPSCNNCFQSKLVFATVDDEAICNCNRKRFSSVPFIQNISNTGGLLNSTAIQLLSLQRNHIETLPKEFSDRFFTNCVRYLMLTDNKISKIEAGAFKHAISSTQSCMIALDLSNNFLTQIAAAAFEGLDNLEYIKLENNNLTSVPSAALNPLHNLTTLSLSYNPLEKLHRQAFASIPSLKKLMLNHCNLTTKNTNTLAFKGLEYLNELDLSDNLFRDINQQIFEPLENLHRLILSKNEITMLHAGDFKYLTTLTTLQLSVNKIITIDPLAFEGLGNLTTLSLASNRLREFSSKILKPLKKLGSLDLSRNYIHRNDSGSFARMNSLKFPNISSYSPDQQFLYDILLPIDTGRVHLLTLQTKCECNDTARVFNCRKFSGKFSKIHITTFNLSKSNSQIEGAEFPYFNVYLYFYWNTPRGSKTCYISNLNTNLTIEKSNNIEKRKFYRPNFQMIIFNETNLHNNLFENLLDAYDNFEIELFELNLTKLRKSFGIGGSNSSRLIFNKIPLVNAVDKYGYGQENLKWLDRIRVEKVDYLPNIGFYVEQLSKESLEQLLK